MNAPATERRGIGRWLVPLVAGVLGGAVGAGGVVLAGGGADKPKVEAIVRDYVLANPELLPEAMERLRDKQNAAAVAQSGNQLTKPFGGAWMGAANADVVLVEFTDYNCGYCRASLPVVERLVAEDPKLKVVFRELPILSEDSLTAARAALAAAKQGQGKYAAFHNALFSGGPVSPASLAEAQRRAGLDVSAATAAATADDVTAEIQANHAMFGRIGGTGTPSWVVGDQILSGAVGYDALKAAIANARKPKG
ncbi:protein-disulfide isomerase [Sphingomonas zeicaulis]|uniref:DsbA family protein n=1 Tax=Sphingomonas zeicaulis TaxID=1632740 RepID=UPI003D1984F0